MNGAVPLSSASPLGRRALPALVLLAAVGGIAALYRFSVGLGAATNLSDGVPWGLWIGSDLALIALSGGAFTTAAAVVVLRRERYRPLLRPMVLLGLLGYLAAGGILLADVGRPDRFWYFLAFHNPRSPLFEVSWCLFLYTGVLVLEFLPAALEARGRGRLAAALHSVQVPLVIAGVTLSILHQATLGTVFLAMPHRLHPLWHTALLPEVFLVSAVGAGLAAAILVALAAGRASGRGVDPDLLEGLGRASAAVWAACLLLRAIGLAWSGVPGCTLAADPLAGWFAVEVAAGVVLPLLLFALPSVRRSPRALATAALLALAGTTLHRFDITLTGQSFPDGTAYTPHLLEIAIQAGAISAAAAAWILAVRRFPVLPRAAP